MLDPLSLLVTSVGSAAGKAAAKETADILRDLVGVQRAEVRVLSHIETRLEAIDDKVTVLLDASFTTGRRHLEDAVLVWDRDAERDRLLQDARTAFVPALSHQTDPLRRSVVAFYLSVVWLALGSRAHTMKYLAEGHLEGLRALASDRRASVADWANALARGRRAGGAQPDATPLFLGLLPCPEHDALMTLAVLEMSEDDFFPGKARGPYPSAIEARWETRRQDVIGREDKSATSILYWLRWLQRRRRLYELVRLTKSTPTLNPPVNSLKLPPGSNVLMGRLPDLMEAERAVFVKLPNHIRAQVDALDRALRQGHIRPVGSVGRWLDDTE